MAIRHGALGLSCKKVQYNAECSGPCCGTFRSDLPTRRPQAAPTIDSELDWNLIGQEVAMHEHSTSLGARRRPLFG
eukprot:scaffold266924_cov28-Tisochrysis_lutea.AAC.2